MCLSYIQKKSFAIAMLLLVVGGLNWGYVAFAGKDVISTLFGKQSLLTNSLFLLVGVSALLIGFYRDSYLPFLGETVFPCSILKEHVPENANSELRVFTKPHAKVLYWAAESENKDFENIPDWRQAYLGYRNAGVTIADENGYATLKVRRPQAYNVPLRTLAPHIHYRICMDDGILGRVETAPYPTIEMFEVSGEDTSEEEIHRTIVETVENSKMPQDGAFYANKKENGAELDLAF